MTPTLALVAAVVATMAIFRSRGDDLAAWGVVALAVAAIWGRL